MGEDVAIDTKGVEEYSHELMEIILKGLHDDLLVSGRYID